MTQHSSDLRRAACRSQQAVILWAMMALVGLLSAASSSAAAPFEWRSATPESQGMSRAKLDACQL